MKDIIKNKLTSWQYFFIIFVSSFSTEFIFLPRLLATVNGTQGMLSLGVFLVIKIILCFLFMHVLKKYENKNLIEIVKYKYGKIVGYIYGLIYGTYLIFIQIALILPLIQLIKAYVLKETPDIVIIVVILILVLYSVSNGIIGIVGMSKGIFYLIIFMSILMVFALRKGDYTNLFPLIQGNFKNIVYSGYLIASLFSGLECAGIYSKYIENKSKLWKVGLGASLCSSIILSVLTIISYAILGKDVILCERWPVLITSSVIQTPITDRPELVFVLFILIIEIMVLIIYAWSFSEIAKVIYNNKSSIIFNLANVSIVFLVVLLIENKVDIESLLRYKQIFIPCLLLFILSELINMKKRKAKGGEINE